MHITIDSGLLTDAQLEAAYDSNQRFIEATMGERIPLDSLEKAMRAWRLRSLREENIHIHELIQRRAKAPKSA